MAKLLKPAIKISSLHDLDLVYWYNRGVRGILIDLDNTISPWRQNNVTNEARSFIKKCNEQGIKIALFTNAKPERAYEVAASLNIPCYPYARKPFPGQYKKVLASLGFWPAQTMTIGDQIFTDILGGNLAGCLTVLIPPLESTEYCGTKILRFFERLIGVRQKPRFPKYNSSEE